MVDAMSLFRWSALAAVVGLVGCASVTGTSHEMGRVVISSSSSIREVFLVRVYEAENHLAPLAGSPQAARKYLQTSALRLSGKGDLVDHPAGDYELAFFCGDRLKTQRVVLLKRSADTPPNRYSVSCAP
jgi:hypothetical protein